jgi:hypothetical protein
VSKRIKIVDLPTSNIKSSLSADAECLLIDTWIVDKSFQGSGHGKTRAHGGYGNSLVLRAIARFWNAASRSLNVTFLIETNSSALMNVLAGLAFKGAGTSKIGADFYEVNKRTLRGMILDSYKRLLQKINALTAVPIADCTVPKPTDWPQ